MTDRPPKLSRRGALRAALATSVSATGVLGAAAPADSRAAAPHGSGGAHRAPRIGALNAQSAVRTLTVGDVRLTYVVDATMELDPVGFLPAVPTGYWREHPEQLTASGRIAASAGGVLVERGRRRLLIDVGLGSNVLAPSLGISHGGALLRTLRALQVSARSIDTVAFTHLHTDHTGLGFLRDDHQVPQPAFPCADYLVADREWEPFWHRQVTVGAPSWDDFMVPLSRVVRRFGDGDEIWPGVTALITPGHSPGHTTYVISATGGRSVLVFGDAFHIPAQITRPDWPSGPDVDVDAVLKARHTLLDRLTAPRTHAFAFHFGDQVFGRVVRDANGARWQPVPARSLLPHPIPPA
jgi:glyoxylase-like metal-dependent hydrolase (beta-lactamase superfamily II)